MKCEKDKTKTTMSCNDSHDVTVSCIVPVKNGLPYLTECLDSLIAQDCSYKFEVCIFDDGSTDGTKEEILRFADVYSQKGIGFHHCSEDTSGGVGFAKNRAVQLSSGRFLCFCDADDVSHSMRIQALVERANKFTKEEQQMLFLGSNFTRIPEGSTERYTRWGNGLTEEQLPIQIYTSHGPTLLAPTWFVSRKLYDSVGGFNEDHNTGFPEDLDFFYKALEVQATLGKVPSELVVYRYHPGCASFGVKEESIWRLRMEHLEKSVLPKWTHFTVWNAGKQGKRFYKSLSPEAKTKVISFCDVDVKKIRHGKYEEYDEKARKVTTSIPIVDARSAQPPLIVCVKLDMTGGDMESIIEEKGWKEGIDYVHFS